MPLQLRTAAAPYRRHLAWQIRIAAGELLFRLAHGTVGHRHRGVILADCDGEVLTRSCLPDGVHLLRAPCEVPLPPTITPAGVVRWLVPLQPTRRWQYTYPDHALIAIEPMD